VHSVKTYRSSRDPAIMPSARERLIITTSLAWVVSLVTSIYYMSLFFAYIDGAKVMLGFNGALSILVWGLVSRGNKDEGDRVLRNLSALHIVTGIVLIFLSLTLVNSVTSVVV